MEVEFSGDIWHWRGPAPYFFVSVPDEECGQVEATAPLVSYGWGMIPVTVQIGDTEWTTALFPKDGGYVVPIKDRVRKAESLDEGATVDIRLTIRI